jgi:hypothetical protein
MNFGSWDWSNPDFESKEQINRLLSARRLESPIEFDYQNKTASFKGTAKDPYLTTLDVCTCTDFIRRKFPCKHIYRLAADLGELDNNTILLYNNAPSEPNYGISNEELFSLPVNSQERLYKMCVEYIYHDKLSKWLFLRDNSEVSLIDFGLCSEIPLTLDDLTPKQIKSAIVDLGFILGENGVPTLTQQRKAIIKWLDDNPNIAEEISTRYVYLEFSDRAKKLAHTIHKRFYSRFNERWVDTGSDTGYKDVDLVFVQDFGETIINGHRLKNDGITII